MDSPLFLTVYTVHVHVVYSIYVKSQITICVVLKAVLPA